MSTAASSSNAPTGAAVLAVAAHPILPVTNGYSLRASNLVRELARRCRVILAAPLGILSPGEVERDLGVHRVAALAQFRGWDARLTDDDRAAVRRTIDLIMTDDGPRAAVVWPGADAAADHPRFPPRVLDRMDSEVVMAWREAKHATNLKDRLRGLRGVALWARAERAMIRGASATTVDAETDARVMRAVSGTSTVHVVPSGVAVQPLSTPSGEAAAPTVVFTGSMSYSANVDAATWFTKLVWPSVRERVPHARFVIAGRSPAPSVVALGSMPGIEVRGDVPDMNAVLRSAWVAICPVQTGSGIRTKVLEAWAVGRPVVMSRVGATGLHLDADARSLVTDDAWSTARHLVRLLQSSGERHRLGASAHALVSREHNGWSAAGERLYSLLTEAALSS